MVFFFGVDSMILQMEIDSLWNFHSAPPVVLENLENCSILMISEIQD